MLAERAEERRRRLQNTVRPKLNMAPMIDVVFQLIIFFMLVTELSRMEIIELTLPQAYEAGADHHLNRIVLNITRDHEMYYMRRELTTRQLRQLLHRAAAQSPKEPDTGLPTLAVKIRADAHVEYGYVQRAMVQCMRERIWQVSFGAMPKEYGN